MQPLAEKNEGLSLDRAVPAPGPDPELTESLPLSFAQQRLWFFSQLEPASPLYNIPAALRLTGTLNPDALRQSLVSILERHEALRTNFVSNSGMPVQVIRSEINLDLPVIDLSASAVETRAAEIESTLLRESQKPFDLAHELLFRAKLFRVSAQEHILFLNIHHIVSDEWSMRIFFRELADFYSNFSGGKTSEPAELPIQYADFAIWQREFLSGDVLEKEIAYWKNQLGENLAPAEIPPDHPRPPVPSYPGDSKVLDLPIALATALRELSRREGATLFMTLTAAFKTLLFRYTGEEQVTIGSPISGRNKVETENLIGFFVNTIVLRTAVSGEISFRELLGRVRETTLGAYAHQDLPFEKLVEELQPDRVAGQVPFIQAMFALQNATTDKPNLSGLEVEPIELDTRTAKFDLTLVARETPRGLTIILEYNTDLYDGGTVGRMLGQYGCLLEAMVANPAEKISRLPLLRQAEREQLLVGWNQTQTDYPRQ
ncbi:MAG: condensation domain-containing protein, partial [Verrucomicrobiota bacterium]